jgi:hypothetical protein
MRGKFEKKINSGPLYSTNRMTAHLLFWKQESILKSGLELCVALNDNKHTFYENDLA